MVDALSLMANILTAWITAQMQALLGRWTSRRQIVPPELIGRNTPTRLEGLNLRGVFRFPLERYAGHILPSQTAAKTSASLRSTQHLCDLQRGRRANRKTVS